MSRSELSSFLRRVLMADGAISAVAGSVMFAGAGALEPLLGVPAGLLRYAGLSLFPWVAYVIYVATRDQLSRRSVWTVIALNAVWVVASVLLLVDGPVTPTMFGYAFILAQALTVAVLTDLEYVGLRKIPVAA
jgi:hypothetical protein